MKANELMIGDWVLVNGTQMQIQAINDIDGEIMAGDELYCLVEDRVHSEDKIEPILLTADILEKNGFKLREGCTSAWDWGKGEFSVHISGTPDCPIGQTLTIYTPGGTVGAAYSSHRTLSDYKFRGVHVFQHALRLCGLKELADNFNVE